MFLGFSLIPLFFLPLIETFNRDWSYYLLFFTAVIILLYFLKKRINIFQGVVGIIWSIFLILSLISTVFSISVYFSYIEFLRYLSYFILFYAVCTLKEYRFPIHKYFIFGLILSTVFLSMISGFNYFFPQVISNKLNPMSLLYPYVGHNHLSDLLVFAIPLCGYISLQQRKILYRWLSFLLSIIFSLLLVFTYGRAALLALVFSFLSLTIFSDKPGFSAKLPKKIINLTAFLGIITAIFLTSQFLYSQVMKPDVNTIPSIMKNFYKPMTNEYRSEYFTAAMWGIQASPLIGSGLDTFRYVYHLTLSDPLKFSEYTHNHILELITEIGIPGGIIFTCLIFFLIYKGYTESLTVSNTAFWKNGLFIGIVACLLQSFLDYNLQYLSVSLILWTSVALLMPRQKPLIVQKRMLYSIFLSVCILLFILGIVLVHWNSVKFIRATDKISSGQKQSGLNIYYTAMRIDAGNYLIPRIIALAIDADFPEEQHRMLQRSILLNPADAKNDILQDYQLYLDQARSEISKEDIPAGIQIIDKALASYPFFPRSKKAKTALMNARMELNGSNYKYLSDNITAFLNLSDEEVSNSRISSEDIHLLLRKWCIQKPKNFPSVFQYSSISC